MGIRGLVLEDMGRRAARSFLSEKTPLNDTISKMAADEGLNEESIKRVCETANNEVDGSLFSEFQKSAMDGGELFYPKFQLADAAKVISGLRLMPKLASVEHRIVDDYDRPPAVDLHAAYDPLLESEMEKAASVEPETPFRPDLALEKLTAMREEIILRKAASDMELDGCAHKSYDHVKQQVLRGSDIRDLYRAAVNRHKDESDQRRVKDLFQHFASRLADEGVMITQDRQAVKIAFAPVPKEERDGLIADLFETPEGAGQVLILNGSYVNDDHPLFCELDILVKQHDEADRYDKALLVVDDKVKYVKRKARGLTFGGA